MSAESSQPPKITDDTIESDLVRALDGLEFPEHRCLEPVSEKPQPELAELGRWLLGQPLSQDVTALSLGEAYRRDFGTLPRAVINRFFFAEKLLAEWFAMLPLDPVLVRLMEKWSPGLATVLVTDPAFIVSENHPLRQLLHLMVSHSFGWFEGLERAGQKWCDYLQQTGDFLTSQEVLDPLQQFSRLDQAEIFVEKEISRARVLEKRVREAELGTDRAWYFRQLVTAKVNQFYATVAMPEKIAKFLAGPWRDSMQLLLMEEGAQSNNWARQCKLIETLLMAVTGTESDQAKHRLYEVAAGLVPALSKALQSFKHNPQLAAAWLEDIQELLMRRVKGQSLDVLQVPQIEVEPGFSVNSDTVTDQGHGLIDKWFLDQHSGVRQKCIAY